MAFPEGIKQLPVPQLWAFLFFFMLFNLGLDSQVRSVLILRSRFSKSFEMKRTIKLAATFLLLWSSL